jgi:hypothetical protein
MEKERKKPSQTLSIWTLCGPYKLIHKSNHDMNVKGFLCSASSPKEVLQVHRAGLSVPRLFRIAGNALTLFSHDTIFPSSKTQPGDI